MGKRLAWNLRYESNDSNTPVRVDRRGGRTKKSGREKSRPPFSVASALERVAELGADDVDVAVVRACQLVLSRACRGRRRGRTAQIDCRVLDEEVGIADVERSLLGDPVLRTDRQPRAVLVRHARRA